MLMNMSTFIYSLPLILSLCFLISPSFSQQSSSPSPAPTHSLASIPFHYINRGNFDVNLGEFNSAFRCVGIHSPKFSLCFYTNINILNSFTLGIGLSYPPKWVWSPNRNTPVRDGASLSLGKDGNLVLADDDGLVVWQTNTANKGVVGFKLLENGNLVLYDANNNFIWQSFDHPSDTLLAGQSLKLGLTNNKLVSNASPLNYFEGNYTLEMSPNNVSLYYKSSNNPTPLPYYRIDQTTTSTTSKEFKYYVGVTDNFFHFTYQAFQYITENNSQSSSNQQLLVETWYNGTYSFLRLDHDGKLRTYDLDPMNRVGGLVSIWKVEFTLFMGEPLMGDEKRASECQMPEKCGEFGVCYKGQCVGCPSPRGLLGWTEKCEPPKLVGCSGVGINNAKYYKIEGVVHFSSMYTEGEESMKPMECKAKCSRDCKCVGFFYDEERLRCWIVYDLKTLTQSDNPKHIGYIKMS